MSIVTLREVTLENWIECTHLRVEEVQVDYVDSNALSLVESKFRPACIPRAIYHQDTMVGFLMYEVEENICHLTRLMIDASFQRKGYATEAMMELIAELKKDYSECKRINLSYFQGNAGAFNLLKNLGFKDTGKLIHGERNCFFNLKES